MKRNSLFLGLVAAVLVWGAGGTEARAGQATLDTLIGHSLNIDGLTFTFLNFTSTDLTASQVTVTYPAPGSSEAGFLLTGAFGALAGMTEDNDLVYTVTAPAGVSITDATLTGNPAPAPPATTGTASVTETLRAGLTPTSPIIMPTSGTNPMFISNVVGPGPVTITFAGQSAIYVSKDIEAIGGNNGVSLSNVTQSFSTSGVPEPGSMALLGIGMSCLLGFRRVLSRSAKA
jgi:hypothetical protein